MLHTPIERKDSWIPASGGGGGGYFGGGGGDIASEILRKEYAEGKLAEDDVKTKSPYGQTIIRSMSGNGDIRVLRNGIDRLGKRSNFEYDNTGTYTTGMEDGLDKVIKNIGIYSLGNRSNLGYFAPVSDETREKVIERLKDEAEITKNKQLKAVNYLVAPDKEEYTYERQRTKQQGEINAIKLSYQNKIELYDEYNHIWRKFTSPKQASKSKTKNTPKMSEEEANKIKKELEEKADKREKEIQEKKAAAEAAEDEKWRQIYYLQMDGLDLNMRGVSRRINEEVELLEKGKKNKFSQDLVNKVKKLKTEGEEAIINEYATEQIKTMIRNWIHNDAAGVLAGIEYKKI